MAASAPWRALEASYTQCAQHPGRRKCALCVAQSCRTLTFCHSRIFSHYLKILAKQKKKRSYFAHSVHMHFIIPLSPPFSVGNSVAFNSLIRWALFILPLSHFVYLGHLNLNSSKLKSNCKKFQALRTRKQSIYLQLYKSVFEFKTC